MFLKFFITTRHWQVGYIKDFYDVKSEVIKMDTEVMSSEVAVGNCDKCNEKRVLINYSGDGFCSTCIREDDHLRAVIGWRS